MVKKGTNGLTIWMVKPNEVSMPVAAFSLSFQNGDFNIGRRF